MCLLYFIIYVIFINIFGFFMMWLDKRKAQKCQFRISEKFLLGIALFLGAFGVYMGMYKFRHKTKRSNFTIGVPCLIVLNLISIYYIITKVILIA